ncbi:hypothetical protein RUM8411_04021 [Ruegeria meonggei]|uniref:Uncharacterized protein n=1 Tax=Ruegeria meonggei TaxID=1446476 RepID=A0A1X7AAP6_9RHOB|nr:hypothetical protein RUM8411_04021 [Ruegeria meonggei]
MPSAGTWAKSNAETTIKTIATEKTTMPLITKRKTVLVASFQIRELRM